MEWDEKYLWPIFVYKHKRVLKRIKAGVQDEIEDIA
jgi:hypothetical protein